MHVLAAGFQATRNIGIAIAVVLSLGWLFYAVINLRSARPETGAERQLAPNRAPAPPDEELEGRKLTRALLAGVAMLVVIGVGLPLYWLAEPGREEGAAASFDAKFVRRGEALYESFGCVTCHGPEGVGGVANYTFTDPNTQETQTVAWKAPALNTARLRFSEDEVRYILVYGRPFSPMSPWGIEGGGPMNFQQIDTLIAFIESIQLTPEEAQAEVAKALATAREQNPGVPDGALLFSLDFASGAYSCARCHTKGFSYDQPEVPGGGALGPNLTGASTVRQFPAEADHNSFVCNGSENGRRYGQQGQGSGKMPGFCSMMTPEQIAAIVDYERSL